MRRVYVLFFALFVSACVSPAQNARDNHAYCASLWQDERLAPLAGKVETVPSTSPPFSILTNNDKPTRAEKEAIHVLAELKELCFQDAFNKGLVIDLDAASNNSFLALLADLHDGKLTYGEFARKRAESNAHFSEMRSQYQMRLMATQLQQQKYLQQTGAPLQQQETTTNQSSSTFTQDGANVTMTPNNNIPQPTFFYCYPTYAGEGAAQSYCISQ